MLENKTLFQPTNHRKRSLRAAFDYGKDLSKIFYECLKDASGMSYVYISLMFQSRF